MTGVEPATLCLASTRSSQLSYTRVDKINCNTARRSVNGDYDSENNGPNGDCTDPDRDPAPDPDEPASEKPAGGVSASNPDVDPAVPSTLTRNRGDLPFTL